MNTSIEKLFEEYDLVEKDRYEIRQIYSFLDMEKKQKLIDNFDKIFANIIKLKRSMFVNQNNIYNNSLENIKGKISKRDLKRKLDKVS